MRRRPSVFAFPVAACLGVLGAGCAREPIVRADALPLRHVVVYRNGVAYFERSGHVDEGEVRFKMKQTEVGDFLATLAVMEQNGSSVRSAAFPLDMHDDDADQAPDGGEAKPKKVKTEDERKGLRTVVLSLDGKAHDLAVGYVAESPVWKPCYRLIVHPDGQADLQAWGVVENLSGEDWKDIKLTLIAGAPLAFQAQLGEPVIPLRPTVTDQGEVIAAVPHGETSLGQEEAQKTPGAPQAKNKKTEREDVSADSKDSPAPPAAAAVPRARVEPAVRRMASLGGAHAGPSAQTTPMAAAEAPPPPPASPVVPSQPRNLQSLASIAAEGATTRYDLPTTVTVPDKNATMVMLLARRVPGEALFLYAPDGGVPDSSSHPFRVARFTNKSGGLLEKGPIAVFEEGSFLGQGLVDPLPDAATATVPFALERSIAVDQERKWDEQGARLVKIENGELTVERDSVTQTKYRLRNGGELPAKMLVRHPRQGGTRLFSPPKDTEDNVGTGTALVPAKVLPHSTGEVVVDERATVRRPTDWFSAIADTAFKAFAADPTSHRDIVAKLTAAWVVRDDIVKKQDTRNKLQQEHNGLSQSTEETRRNLRAIEKNRVADALRAKLTQRLAETANRLDEVTKQMVDLDSKLSELRVRFKEGVRDIKLWDPAHLDLSAVERFRPLGRDFFEKDALRLARDLVGAYLVVRRRRRVRVVRIVETEAYRGPGDAACHARAGLTRRNRSLFGRPGHAYVFFVYGMHHCFNVVCLGEGRGHAVLIRAGEPVVGIASGQRTDGPGRVARALGITLADDGLDVTSAGRAAGVVGRDIFVSAREDKVRVHRGPRVGVAYAGAVAERPWRFYDSESRHVSRPPKGAIGLGRR